MVPNSDKSVYLLLVAAIALISWLGLQMIGSPPRAERNRPPEPAYEVAEPKPRPRRTVRVVTTRKPAPVAARPRRTPELDRVVVFESDFRPGEFNLAGVLRYLDWKLDARIELSEAARAARSRSVRLPAHRSTAREVLDHVTLLAGLHWELRDGRIRISALDEVA